LERPAIEGGEPLRREPLFILPKFDDDEIRAVVEVLKSGRLTSHVGNKVREFEDKFSSYLGVKHSIATFNGTTALHTSLRALGIGPGDEVITTPFTFVATATSILHQNAIPIFADIDRETFNLDPSSVEERITEHTRAILVVHLCGHPAEMDELISIARERGLALVEDCAQALGAEYKGRKVGTLGNVAAFSFYLSKNITTGEGGMVATDEEEVAEKARLIIDHGQRERYSYELLGYNYRMTELQAVIGLIQLSKLDEMNKRREEIAKIYMEEFSGEEALILPEVKSYVKHVWHVFDVLVDLNKVSVSRDRIVEAVRKENVYVSVAYPRPLYLEPIFRDMVGHGRGCPWSCPLYRGKVSYFKGLCPNAEWVSERVITLSTQPSLSDEEVMDIAKALRKVVSFYRRH